MRPEVEPSAIEENTSAVVSEGTEPAGRVLQCLDDAIEALAGGIGDAVEEVAQEVGEMLA